MRRLLVADAESVNRPSPGGGTRAPFPGSPMANWSDREGQLQIAIMRWLKLSLPHGWLSIHVPNGGLRTAREAAKFKALGVLPGIPDIVILGRLEPPQGPLTAKAYDLPGTWFLEVKAPPIRVNGRLVKAGGRLSSVQLDCHDRLRDLGFCVAVVDSIDETRIWCQAWRLPIRDVTDAGLFAARAVAA